MTSIDIRTARIAKLSRKGPIHAAGCWSRAQAVLDEWRAGRRQMESGMRCDCYCRKSEEVQHERIQRERRGRGRS